METISRQLSHQVINRLQIVIGELALAALEKHDEEKRLSHMDKARTIVKSIAELLRKHEESESV